MRRRCQLLAQLRGIWRYPAILGRQPCQAVTHSLPTPPDYYPIRPKQEEGSLNPKYGHVRRGYAARTQAGKKGARTSKQGMSQYEVLNASVGCAPLLNIPQYPVLLILSIPSIISSLFSFSCSIHLSSQSQSLVKYCQSFLAIFRFINLLIHSLSNHFSST